MSLKLNTVVGSLRPTPPQLNILILNSRSSHRLWRRPSRRKRSTYLVIRSSSSYQLSSSSYSSSSSSSQDHNLFHTFLSQLNSLDLLAPALGFTSALAILYNSTRPHLSNGIGDWNLFTSPTPFNRFVKLRCESLLLEDSNEKLIKEEGHLVCFDSGPIQQTGVNENYHTHDVLGKKLSYQRICVKTDDGGVVSLDWPANLDLTNEHGLDTTILIVPGTTDGSMDENVMSFVYECLKRGCFPIVMNPRGCARSPITTPRLFTAADSDDVYTAVQFVNKARPWTTLMGVGLGYGANMLTKYLAEVGEGTPLTAATCLDNPFDLKRATVSPDHLYVNQNLTDGLVDMLKSNKELFQGRSKGFDIEKALQAKSLEEFDEAISMVSYGFDSIEEFHVNSSTRDIVGKIKIPLLFIQQNDVVSSFSLPRGLIAENPYTSLLTCTFQLNDKSNTGTSAVSWCQHLVVEWLTAVELGLLKGRHPLLEDTDVTISPSKRVKLMASKPSHLDDLDGNISYPSKKMLKTNDAYSSSVDLQKFKEKDKEFKAITNGTVTQTNDANASSGDLQKFEEKDKELKTITNGTVAQTNLVDTELEKEGDIDLADSERGKMLQATKVVMNMLDVTMPEALSEEQKEKVLTAIGQGETLMNALQGAVPEDVRGKLTSAVTGILQSQKKILNGLSSISKIPDVTPVLNTKIQEKPGPSSQVKESNTSEHIKGDTSLPEDSNNHPSKNDASSGVAEHEAHGGNISNSAMKNHEELGSNNQSADFSKEKTAQHSHIDDSDSSAATDISSKVKTSGSSGDQVNEQVKPGHEGGKPGHEGDQPVHEGDKPVHEGDKPGHEDDKPGHEAETKEKVNQQKEETNAQNPNDQKSITTPVTEESSSPSASSPEVGDNQKKEESSAQPVPSNTSPNAPSFSVSHALDALTGMDDSTQLAVNSVFSVIEDVITQLEGSKDDDPAIDEKNEVEDTSKDSEKKHQTESESDLQQKKDEGSNITTADFSKLSTEKKEEAHNKDDIQHSIAKLPYRTSLYDQHVQSHLLSNVEDVKSLDSDAGSPLFLDYVPEEGQWKLLGKSGDGDDDVDNDNDVIEPAYVILDSDGDWDNELVKTKDKLEIGDDGSMVLMQRVKENLLKSLKVEVCRRIDATDMVDMAPTLKKELEHVANAVSVAVVNEKQSIISWDGEDLFGPGNPHAERILDAITSAVQGTRYMKKVIPVGIVVGSSLASLKKVFNIAAADSIGTTVGDQAVADEMPLDKIPNKKVNSDDDEYEEEDVSSSLGSDTAMVGAVTAALGASALLVNQQGLYGDGLESSISSLSFNQKEKHGEPRRLEENSSKSSDDNIVTSLAEKAMMVAGPVMPMKEGGEVDQERLVAMLADLGQRGGILRLVGKLALLWGGLRGAMSLIGKLISFLRLSERPLFQRILGFVSLVLVLWMPVVVPLLPTLVQNWAAHNSSGFAELACIIGLYSSVMVLVVLWGKRIRGYEDPFERYGIKFTSTTQIKNLLFGLIGGVMLVSLIQFTNMSLGLVSISWSAITPSSTDPVTLLKLSGYVLKIAGQGLITATAIALVEELVFRSWLPEEIGTDLGYNQGIILSALAFSISQWSLKAIPGLWLLSLGLAGVRQRCQGSLSLPIGLRAGIMASSFVLKEGSYLIFRPNYPSWVIDGGDPFQPFNSVAGLALALLWAVILYPKRPLKENINEETESTPL